MKHIIMYCIITIIILTNDKHIFELFFIVYKIYCLYLLYKHIKRILILLFNYLDKIFEK